jgi:PrgI family protein
MSPAERNRNQDVARVRIPADVEREDKLLAGLTARQLAILAASAVILWAIYAATRRLVPLPVFGIVALPVGATAALLALGRFEGIAADRWVHAAWRHHRSDHRLVPAPDGVPAPPTFLAAQAGPVPAPLRLPFAAVAGDGTIDVGHEGLAIVCRASAVTFSLRTPGEQEALVAGFARWLNSLAEPAQILVRAEPFDLAPSIDALLDAAPELAHPALEAAARDHAHFLATLAERADLLRREVLVVMRQPAGTDAATRLVRRAHEATVALGAAGVTLVVLDGPAALSCVARALDPAGPVRPVGLGGTDEPVVLAHFT